MITKYGKNGRRDLPKEYFGSVVPEPILNDLLFRFLINMRQSDKNDILNVCAEIEQAHWFYIDFYCYGNSYPDCIRIEFREFARQVFYEWHFLRKWRKKTEGVIDQFLSYKGSVPTYGVIMLDSTLTEVLLVQGYSSSCSWGFPKGKLNANELPIECAIRETFEETGYDATKNIVKTKRPLQQIVGKTFIRLYFAKDVSKEFKFCTPVRNEIKKISWFKLDNVPTEKSNKFYTVVPFIKDIKAFSRRELRKQEKSKLLDPPKYSILKRGEALEKQVESSISDLSNEIMQADESTEEFFGTSLLGITSRGSVKEESDDCFDDG
uniref:mRNA-decapping enzyme 2 n=1 Tax=Ditylenchus dipsaci TaxID=166011 RepID=A0A915DZR7_9BILA